MHRRVVRLVAVMTTIWTQYTPSVLSTLLHVWMLEVLEVYLSPMRMADGTATMKETNTPFLKAVVFLTIHPISSTSQHRLRTDLFLHLLRMSTFRRCKRISVIRSSHTLLGQMRTSS